jgi:hypothetical protein
VSARPHRLLLEPAGGDHPRVGRVLRPAG